MAKLTITGSIIPVVGNIEPYSLSVFENLITSNSFSFPPPKIQWNIHVQDRKGWRITQGNIKEGERITYRFTHKSLKYKALKIEVVRGTDRGELYIKPRQAEEPKILRVDLLDLNSQRIQKGKVLHYTDTLIAKAHCVGMFGQKVSFTLWEDDAIGKGHDPIINMMNRINPVPLVGEVDHEGIAKVIFRLPGYTMAVQMANARVAKGDKNEGKTHEYYVTAEMVSKHMVKASPNLNIANPSYIPEVPEKREQKETHPVSRKPPTAPEKMKEKPVKPKPKEETPKFPQTPAARQQTDIEGKILSAAFTDGTGSYLKRAKTGDRVSIKISSQNMRGKNVKIRIWEEDLSKYSNDLIYEISATLVYNTTNFINGIVLTKDMYLNSYEWGEGKDREYFIEVEHLNTAVTSQVIPISPAAEPVKVDANDSPAIIKEPKQKKKVSCICQEQYKDLVWGGKVSCEFRKRVVQIAKNLGLPQKDLEGANWLMTIIALESAYSFNPKIGTFGKDPDESKANKYIGLIQFGKGAASDVGTTRTHLMSLTAEQQLEFVEKHFKQKKFDKLLISRTALYLAVNYPNSTKHASNKNYVVYDSSNAAYDSNDLFKREKHEYKIKKNGAKEYPDDVVGSTHVWEMEEALEEVGNLGKSHKPKTFECGANNSTNEKINTEDIVTYHIYENGTIEKHIPKKIKDEYMQKYKYVYHDKEKNEHEICIVDWFTVDKRNNGKKISSIPKGYINTYSYPSGGNAKMAYEYSNGDICVSGTEYGYRKYSKGQGKVPLVKMKDNLNYKKNDVKIFYSFQRSQRRYCNPDAYAGFIGALAKLGREDVLCTGMCFADATSYPSVTHPNGDCADTAYYSTQALEQKKVNAFKAFHFEKIYRGKGGWYSKLTGTNYSPGHEDHLHSGEFNTNIIKIIKEK